ncbi:Protein ROS1 [Acorus gramineus]|uniref:Protein ROS1 n=1 Tax=Acorus gramineus TaxID=55184 RepID=A0AAV9AH06_ACOGR|nr:Protein ROS1 [Acorus gramineus]
MDFPYTIENWVSLIHDGPVQNISGSSSSGGGNNVGPYDPHFQWTTTTPATDVTTLHPPQISQMSQYHPKPSITWDLDITPLTPEKEVQVQCDEVVELMPPMEAALPHPMEENMDKNGIDLSKTPPQKLPPKRRKYTPKVVREDKRPRAQKAKTETAPNAPKRKYVHRVANFTETQASPIEQSNFDSCVPNISRSSVQFGGQGMEVVLENSLREFTFDLNNHLIRMIDDYIWSPSTNSSNVPQADPRKQHNREKPNDITRQKSTVLDNVNVVHKQQRVTLAEADFPLLQAYRAMGYSNFQKRRRTERIYIDLTTDTTSNCDSTIINDNMKCTPSTSYVEGHNQEVWSGVDTLMNLLPTQNQANCLNSSVAFTPPHNPTSLSFTPEYNQTPTQPHGSTLTSLAFTPECNQAQIIPYFPTTVGFTPICNQAQIIPYYPTTVGFTPKWNTKQKPQARVSLDSETIRVHNHLMLTACGDGSETMDEEKARWWEKEREVFRTRTDAFIRRMHEIQGDRTFSPWKGSVVDSVVGVFLTQNVSDHLSSSAFMALAAKFPLPSNNTNEASTSAEPQEISIIELDDTGKWQDELCQGGCSQESMVQHNVELVGQGKIEKDSDSDVCRRPAEKGFQLSPENGTDMRNVSSLAEDENGRSPEDGDLSQNSVSSSQNSSEYPIVTVDQMESSPESNHEAEELPTGYSGSKTTTISVMDLLQMVENNEFEEIHANRSRSNSEETFITACHQLNFPGDLQRRPSFDLKSVSGTFQSECNLNLPLMRSSDDPKGTIDVPYTSNHLHSGQQPGNMDTEYRNLLEGLTQKQGSVLEDHMSTLRNNSEKNSEESSKLIYSEWKGSGAIPKETPKRNLKGKKIESDTKMSFDWDSLRREACSKTVKRGRSKSTRDSVDWEAVRNAPVQEISNAIRERGMNNLLAGRIKDFLNRVVRDHESIDLEWLRDAPPDKVKEYLLSIYGLGLKSVECVRLLTLHHHAFPVDTNVGRICVRLGWVPLEPLPGSLELHLLEMYPILESIQKYLWPRLCTLDQRTLYELHYQMITFGKVFCTKSKPNCNACPLKTECKHFASAFTRAEFALPGLEEKSLVSSTVPFAAGQNHRSVPNPVEVLQIEGNPLPQERFAARNCEPIIEEPTTPEPEPECAEEISENDIEEAFWKEDQDEIPPINQNYEALKQNIQSIIESNNMDIENSGLSKALVALNPVAASIPMPKLKNVNRLRTEHLVYELPDGHPLLKEMDRREPDDPCPYLLAIWTPGETAQSFQPPETCCNLKDSDTLCHKETCFSCKSIQEANSQTVRGTLLIPCRTAMRGSFPLNGTYFQVNEVFADHESSQKPIIVPRRLIWNLPRRTVYFGTSTPSIFKGMTIKKRKKKIFQFQTYLHTAKVIS